MAGSVPQSSLRVSASAAQPAEIIAANDGDIDEPLPQSIQVRWIDGRLLAADALEGYTIPPTNTANTAVFQLTAGGAVLRLRPSSQRSVGWLRFESATPVDLSVSVDSIGPSGSPSASPRDRF
jgi:hypothetical protein